jgi:hypothetical protein
MSDDAVELIPRSADGRELLDRLEAQTMVVPYAVDMDGARSYWLDGLGNYEAVLDGLDPEWREHITQDSPKTLRGWAAGPSSA